MLLPAGRSYRLVVDTACGLLGWRQQDSLHERARRQPGDLYDELCRSLADQAHQNSTGDNQPAWSPDGTRIAFISNREGSSDVFVMKADGTGVKRLVTFLAGETDPAWSPSGKKIAFVSNSGSDPEIWVMNQDGSNKTQFTNNPATDSSPDWSPNGKKIAFESNRGGDPSNFEFYSMRPVREGGTNQPVNLTTTAGQNLSPAYSPDGKKIAVHSNRDGDAEIFVMDATGSSQDQLTTNSSTADFDPSWQPRP